MKSDTFIGRVGLQQRVIPSYRAAFIDALAKVCQGGLSVFAGQPLKVEGIDPVDKLHVAKYVHAKNRYISDPGSSMFLCWQSGFMQWLDKWQPEVLIVEANPRYTATRLAVSWMHRRGRKVIGWGLGAPPINGLLSSLRRWERLSLLQSLDGIIAYSQQGAEQYQKLGLAPERVYVAPNAIAPKPSSPPPQRPAEFNGKATVLFVGRLQSRKRVDLLLQACSALPQEIQPHVVIVGDGPSRTELEKLARQIYPHTEFVGAKHGGEVELYFANADLFVLPGTGGLAIQQAMAFALPVIVARGDGTQDDLVRNENGWQVPADDLQSLTNALRKALSDPSMLRQMGNASYRIVAEEINVDKMVEVFIQAMNNLSKT
jgi:glycosyltransferase involved in cell wall biosynthesis